MVLPLEAPGTFEDLRQTVAGGFVRVLRHRGHAFLGDLVEKMASEDDGGSVLGLLLAITGNSGFPVQELLQGTETLERLAEVCKADQYCLEELGWVELFLPLIADPDFLEFAEATQMAFPSDAPEDLALAQADWADFAMWVEDLLAKPEDDEHFVVLVGDFGGQAYAACRKKYVRAQPGELEQLVKILDKLAWACNKGEGAMVQVIPPGGGHYGMGGCQWPHKGVWIHPELADHRGDIEAVLRRGAPFQSLKSLRLK